MFSYNSRIFLGGRPIGSVGLIGPQRINYSKVVTIMSQVMKELNKSLKDQEYWMRWGVRMEENKDFKAEEITKENQSAVEENELVTEDTEATSKEEAEEIVEEYIENDDLALIGKMKDENKKLSNEVDALKERLLRLTAEYDNYRKEQLKKRKEYIQMLVQMY